MVPIGRRRVLSLVAAVSTVSLAGCMGDDPSGTLHGEAHFDGGSFEVLQSGTSLTMVPWDQRHGEDDEVALFDSEDAVYETLIFDTMENDDRADAEAFIAETSFPDERLLYVGTWGNYHEYRYVLVQSLALRDDVLDGTFAAYADQEVGDTDFNSPTALIRVQFDDDPIDRAVLTVIQGGGRERVGGGEETEYDVSVVD